MRYSDAVAALIHGQGESRLYWNGMQSVKAEELLEAAVDVDTVIGLCEQSGEYIYYLGPTGDRPGVYRLRADEAIDPEPTVETFLVVTDGLEPGSPGT